MSHVNWTFLHLIGFFYILIKIHSLLTGVFHMWIRIFTCGNKSHHMKSHKNVPFLFTCGLKCAHVEWEPVSFAGRSPWFGLFQGIGKKNEASLVMLRPSFVHSFPQVCVPRTFTPPPSVHSAKNPL